MKDIVDYFYFTSPLKARKSSEAVVKSDTPVKEQCDQNVNTLNKIKEKPNLSEQDKEEAKVKKRKRRRKPTDPEVRNVVELLSKNLSLISPNRSGIKVNSPSPTKKTQKVVQRKSGNKTKSPNIVVNKSPNLLSMFKSTQKSNKDVSSNTGNISIELDNSNIHAISAEENMESPKVNAFQFLMNSRNNVIGLNSEGKVNTEEIESVDKGKEDLHARKNLFKNWAELKGASKRKREQEEIENCINVKLSKRAKRLKKLIQGDKKSEENEERNKQTPLLKNKKKVRKIISSESEGSDGIPVNNSEFVNSPLSKVTEVVIENAQDIIISKTSSPEKKYQCNLLSFLGVVGKEKTEDLEIFDEESPNTNAKEIIKIKMFTPQSTKKKKSILSLNKKHSKTLDLKTDESSQEGGKVKKPKKKTHKSKDVEETLKTERTLDDSIEDFCATKKNDKPKKDHRKKKFKKNMANSIISDSENSNSKDSNSRNNDNKNINKPTTSIDSINTENVEDATKKNDKPKKDHCKKKLKRNMANIIISDSENSSENSNSKDSNSKNNDNKNINKPTTSIDSINTENVEDIQLICNLKENETTNDSGILVNKTKMNDSRKNSSENKFQGSAPLTPSTRKKKSDREVTNHTGFKAFGASEEENKISSGLAERRSLRKRNSLICYQEIKIDLPKTTKKEKQMSTPSIRKLKNTRKNESIEKVELSSDSETEEIAEKKFNPVKVAPVFLKATPKPKVDPKIFEARKKFLESGIPDSLKKTIEKQKSIEEKEFDVFPAVSHIQQICDSKFWNLSNPDLNYIESISSLRLDDQSLKCQDLIVKTVPYEINLTTEIEKVKHLKSFLLKIKSQNPDYPVFKVFRHVYEKSGKNLLKNNSTKKRTPKRRSKKSQSKSTELEEVKVESISKDYAMWTEKYKPRSSEEILGNYLSVNRLRKWLEIWMNYSEEINARKRKRALSNSESEFESTDCDSRDSTRLPDNTMILYGPCGSGKTSTVYALANELRFNVLEFNASTKRTGKRLLQELQEATQSHQVRKNDVNSLSQFMNPNQKKTNKKSNFTDKKSYQKDTKKMCILLLEDIDLIFDQDEGFLSSLSQLISTSKRPIILTTTDNSPPHVQKFISQYECTCFMPLSLQCLGVWLQIVCLVEGLLVDKDSLGNLLEYNKGDIRKTLLEVQFWSQSGGQLEKSRTFPLKTLSNNGNNVSSLKATDDELHIQISDDETSNDEYFIHQHCLGSFEIFRVNEEYSIPLSIDVGSLWWNFPNLLNVPSGATERLHRQNNASKERKETITNDDSNNIDKLKAVSKLYDSLILTDSLFKTLNCYNSSEPIVKSWSVNVLDSLELTERKEECDGIALDLAHDISHTLVNGCIKSYRRIAKTSCALNMALPDSSERRWRANQHMAEDFLKEAIPLSNTLQRSSIALDYLPTLRHIVRLEDKRAASNTKRGNRFRHYLKDLNITNFKQSTCNMACNMLNIE